MITATTESKSKRNFRMVETTDRAKVEPLDVAVGNEILGRVEPRDYRHDGKICWHACFNLDKDCDYGMSLTQGFGSTPELAIEDAITKARLGIEQSIAALDALEAKLYGGGE